MKKSLICGAIALLALILPTIRDLSAAGPTWWSDSANGTSFIDGNATANNYAPLNIGQLKNVASKAKNYLDAKLTAVGGSGMDIGNLVSNLTHNSTLDYQPANLGQLKAVAKPYYDRLIAVGYDTRSNLIANGYPASWVFDYPWDPGTPASENYVPANLGQLKMAFSFDLSGVVLTDTDGDGIIFSTESFRGTSPTTADTDGDGSNDAPDAAPLDPAFATVPSLFVGDTSYPNITLVEPTGAVLFSHTP